MRLTDTAAEATTPAAETRDGDLLATLRALLPGLSKSHQRLAEMVLTDPHQALQGNIDDLAERAGVGKPTVVRFARAVGCEGFRDFKLRLAGALALGAAYLHRAVRPGDTNAEVLNNIVGSSLSALAEWHRSLDADRLAAAAGILNAARRVDCYGIGQTSHFIAHDCQARLFRMGLNCTAFSDVYLQLVAAATLTPQDAVVAISYVGRMPVLLETVETAKSHGARILAITRRDTPLARLADVVLPVDVPADATMLVGTDAYITQTMMIEVLTTMLGRLRGPECVRRLEQIHRLLQSKVQDTDVASTVYWGWSPGMGI